MTKSEMKYMIEVTSKRDEDEIRHPFIALTCKAILCINKWMEGKPILAFCSFLSLPFTWAVKSAFWMKSLFDSFLIPGKIMYFFVQTLTHKDDNTLTACTSVSLSSRMYLYRDAVFQQRLSFFDVYLQSTVLFCSVLLTFAQRIHDSINFQEGRFPLKDIKEAGKKRKTDREEEIE